MSADAWLVVAVLVATVALFASDRFRLDLVALLALLALLLSGVLTSVEALAGFSSPLVLTIAGLFVVGAGIFQTGLADRLGRVLDRSSGASPGRTVLLLMLVTGLLSSFISSTGTVAVMLPVALSLARRRRIPASRLLMPLAFASLLGGTLTLIGTPPNLVVSDQLRAQGLPPFGFFAFTPPGLAMLTAGILFLLLLGPRLLPKRATPDTEEELTKGDLEAAYGVRGRIARLTVRRDSSLAGRPLSESRVRSRYGVNILALESREAHGWRARRAEPDSLVRRGDRLLAEGDPEAVDRFAEAEGATVDERGVELPDPVHLAELILPPRSSLLGNNAVELQFRRRFGVTILAEKRSGRPIELVPSEAPLAIGDTLLVAGSRKALGLLRERRQDFIVVSEPDELKERPLDRRRAPLALAILVGMLLLMTLGLVASVTAVLLAAVAMVASGCLAPSEAYRSINAESVVLIAAVLPLATALDKTGLVDLAVGGMTGALAGAGPLAVMAALFLATSALSQVVSNTATTVLLAPVAFQLSTGLGISPETLLMTVALAASTAFATPVASPVNALVLNPGGYRFLDFVRVGVPLQLLMLAVTLLVVPLVFPP